MEKDPYQIIKRPLLTEKGSLLRQLGNKVMFEVDRRATKVEIRQAVERIFSVTVIDVNTINMQGRSRRRGRIVGRTPDWKKAIVTLKEGETIEVFEGT